MNSTVLFKTSETLSEYIKFDENMPFEELIPINEDVTTAPKMQAKKEKLPLQKPDKSAP